MMEYKIISDTSPNSFSETVQEHLDAGWKLNGSPFAGGAHIYQCLTLTRRKVDQNDND